MEILAHRGWWQDRAERNSVVAFERAFGAGYGVELDVRDRCGELVVSHDPPRGDEPLLAEVVARWRDAGTPSLLAVNVKADGLQGDVLAVLADVPPSRWFVFDASVPDTRHWLSCGAPVYTRHSELEPDPALYADSTGVWLDAFAGQWWDLATVRAHTRQGKQVCVVSPELHGRDPQPVWELLQSASPDGLSLCTDHPELARKALT